MAITRRSGPAFLALVLMGGCNRDLSVPPPLAPGTVQGRVVYSVPGQSAPVPAMKAVARVLSTSLQAVTGADGRFLLGGLGQSQGRLLIQVDLTGNGIPDRQTLLDLADIHAGPGRDVALGDVSVLPNASVRGRALRADLPTPGGHGGTAVFVPAGPFLTQTGDDGTFVLPDLPSGRITLTFFRAGYDPQAIDDIALAPGQELRLTDVKLLPSPPTVTPQGTIAGTVSLVPTASDASAITLTASAASGAVLPAVQARSDGSFIFPAVPPDLYRIQVARNGYATATLTNVVVGAGLQAFSQVTLVASSPPPTTSACVAGTSCALAEPCRLGQVDCSTLKCVDLGAALEGTACGPNQVCSAGRCAEACVAGLACTPPNPCHAGVVGCLSGSPACGDLGVALADGTPCGAGKACAGGACGSCTGGAACVPANPCHIGSTSCTNGQAVCGDLGTSLPAGTGCGAGLVCSSAGACVSCANQSPCSPANPCHAGLLDCNTGAPVCVDQNSNLPAATSCGPGQLCTAFGSCVVCAAGEACSSGSSRTVTGTPQTVYVQDNSLTTAVGALPAGTGSFAGLLVPEDSPTGYRIFPAPAASAPTFSIAGVPTGSYLLELIQGGVPNFYSLTTSNPDLTVYSSSRPDLLYPQAPTPVLLNFTNLIPWTATSATSSGDQLWLHGSQPGVEIKLSPGGGSGQPAPAATSWSVVVDWSSRGPFNGLPDGSNGDVLFACQRATTPLSVGPSGPQELKVFSRCASLTSATLTSGAPATLNFALVDVPLTESFLVDVKTTQFAALASSVNPGAVPTPGGDGSLFIARNATPHGASPPYPLVPQARLAALVLDAQGPDATYGPFAYGGFLDPGLWKELWRLTYTYDVSFSAPGGATASPYQAVVSSYQPAAGPSAAFVPGLGPVKAPLLNGLDAFAGQQGVGLQPVLSWSPPTLGVPTSYSVGVYQVQNVSGDTNYQQVLQATVRSTSFQIPPGLLAPGSSYIGVITAIQAPWDRPDGPPLLFSGPNASADCVTGMFSTLPGGTGSATSEIDGTWSSACSPNGGPGGGKSNELTLVFSAGSYTYMNVSYSDASCATPVLWLAESGSFTVGAAEASPAGSRDINFVQASSLATSLTAAETTLLNTGAVGGGSICTGITFVTHAPVSLANASCGNGTNNRSQAANGATILGIYLLNNSQTPHTFQIGATSVGDYLGAASPSARPTTLNTDLYVKQ